MKKVCPKCKKEMDDLYFAIDRSTKDGLRSYCRECDREKGIKYRKKMKFNGSLKKRYRKSNLVNKWKHSAK